MCFSIVLSFAARELKLAALPDISSARMASRFCTASMSVCRKVRFFAPVDNVAKFHPQAVDTLIRADTVR